LKFRLPYVENRQAKKTKINYLNGDVYFQIWPPSSSSETRFYVKENANVREYDCLKYENQMHRFNMVERVCCYHHDYGHLPGLDHCYDCRAEVHVLDAYVNSFDKIISFCKRNQDREKMLRGDVVTHVSRINEHLEADKKTVKMTWKGKDYSIRFLDIKHGKQIDKICTSANECRRPCNKRINNNWSNRPVFVFKSTSDDATTSLVNEALRNNKREMDRFKGRLNYGTKITGHLHSDQKKQNKD